MHSSPQTGVPQSGGPGVAVGVGRGHSHTEPATLSTPHTSGTFVGSTAYVGVGIGVIVGALVAVGRIRTVTTLGHAEERSADGGLDVAAEPVIPHPDQAQISAASPTHAVAVSAEANAGCIGFSGAIHTGSGR